MILSRTHRSTTPLVCFTLALLAGCQKGPAYGSDDAVIAVVDPAIRSEVEPILREALEREVFTTRAEREFLITYTTPGELGQFEQWKRLVVIEPLEGATLVPDLVDADQGPVVETVEDEWARDQTIYVLAASTPEATVELVRSRADSLYRDIRAAYEAHQLARMWASGRDSATFRAMLAERGFGIVLPRVYDPAPGSAPDSSRVFYNQNPRRVIGLHWTALPEPLSPDTVLAIRASWAETVHPDEVLPDRIPSATEEFPSARATDGPEGVADTSAAAVAGVPIQASRTELSGNRAVRLQGVWRGSETSNAGVFLSYGVACGDRLVLLDGDLYAPDRDKAPYLLQLEHIFSTFRCEAGG